VANAAVSTATATATLQVRKKVKTADGSAAPAGGC
jgi:hypothetical protein